MTTPQSQAHSDAMRCAALIGKANSGGVSQPISGDAAIILRELKLEELYECAEVLRLVTPHIAGRGLMMRGTVMAHPKVFAQEALAALEKGKV